MSAHPPYRSSMLYSCTVQPVCFIALTVVLAVPQQCIIMSTRHGYVYVCAACRFVYVCPHTHANTATLNAVCCTAIPDTTAAEKPVMEQVQSRDGPANNRTVQYTL